MPFHLARVHSWLVCRRFLRAGVAAGILKLPPAPTGGGGGAPAPKAVAGAPGFPTASHELLPALDESGLNAACIK